MNTHRNTPIHADVMFDSDISTHLCCLIYLNDTNKSNFCDLERKKTSKNMRNAERCSSSLRGASWCKSGQEASLPLEICQCLLNVFLGLYESRKSSGGIKEAYLRSSISQEETLNQDFSQQEEKSTSEIWAPPDQTSQTRTRNDNSGKD